MDAATVARRRLERAAFHALFTLAPDARQARLSDYARDDPALARSVRHLLAAADADVVADATANDRRDLDLDDAPLDRSRTVVGERFRLTRLLGVGGMGEVYLAERTDDVQQRVALKLVRSDLPVSHARARRERQILAKLNHPHIAGLVDAGVADTGQPWFAMEYVEGERITDWCDHRRLDLHARARLFARVCAAVQFAHKNLVLHRDLKPSNILVDAEGRPKLLDFGIAKLLDTTDEQETLTLALTPAYAAPEQLRGEAATTASDIYQLGLVLYELAGGVTAHSARASAPQGGMTTSLPRPGQVLAAMGKSDRPAAERIARERGSGLDALRRQLNGDLARIIAKACDDDPHERYATAQALADDLERWADGLPVSAHRGSFAYRLRKLVRRHAWAAAAIVVLSLGLIATTFIALDRAHLERLQRDRAEQQREAAEQQHQLADQQRHHAETLLGFVHDMFREGDPDHAQGASLSAADLLVRASAKLDQRTDIDEDTRAVLLAEIADVFNKLGKTELALGPAQRAHAKFVQQRDRYPIDYLKNISTLADIYLGLSRYQDAADLIEAALSQAQRIVDDQHHWHASLLQLHAYALLRLGRGAKAETETNAALAEFEDSDDKNSQAMFDALSMAANVFNDNGESRQAADLYRRLGVIIENNPGLERSSVLQAIANKGINDYAQGDAKSAIATLAPLIPRLVSVLGAAHFTTLNAHVWLAFSYLATGNYESAGHEIDAIDTALSRQSAPDLQIRLMTDAAKAKYLLCIGQFAKAESLTRKLVELSHSGVQSKRTWLGLGRILGEALVQERRVRDAIDVLKPTLREMGEISSSKPHWTVAVAEDSLGRAYALQGDWPQAQMHLQRAIALFGESQGAATPNTLRSQIHLLWAQALLMHDIAARDRLAGKRADLITALGGDDSPQIWQLDLLIDDLDRTLGHRDGDPERRAWARAGLARLTGMQPPPRFVGLSSF